MSRLRANAPLVVLIVLTLGLLGVVASWLTPRGLGGLLPESRPLSDRLVSGSELGPLFSMAAEGAGGAPLEEPATAQWRRFTTRGPEDAKVLVQLVQYADAAGAERGLAAVSKSYAWAETQPAGTAQIARATNIAHSALTIHGGIKGRWLVLVLVEGRPILTPDTGAAVFDAQYRRVD